MYESKKQAPLSRSAFMQRLSAHLAIAAALLGASLAAGIAGYMALEKLSPLDAFLNAAMLLGGMGPVNPPATSGGKLFAGLYALYAGLVFIVTAALIFTRRVVDLMGKLEWDDSFDYKAQRSRK